MTTFTYTTKTQGGRVSSESAVEDLLSEYYFTVEPTLQDDVLSFEAFDKPNGAFGVYQSEEQMNEAEDEFFNRLAEYLVNSIEVKCVETQGDSLAAYKWTVRPTGAVEFNAL